VRVCYHDGAVGFLAAADPFFRSDPFSANVIAVVADRIATGMQPDSGDNLWVTVEDGTGKVLGVVMHTPPHAVFLSRMPDEAAAAVAHALADAGREVPGANGACDATTSFARVWTARTGQPSVLVTAMRMYRLGELRRPAQTPGAAIVANEPGDAALVAEWLAAFHDEAQPHAPILDWVGIAERLVAAAQVHLWLDASSPVALAAVSAPVVGVVRVGPVYTPPRFRRNGYGAAVTAAATAAALAEGAEQVVLYTDLGNPTSNSIYQAIGFEPDHNAEEISFRRTE
jgi:predicted GNAT family acetyltransferase